MNGVGKKRRLRPRQIISHKITEAPRPKRSSRQREIWAIELADMVEMPQQEIVSRCEQDLKLSGEEELHWVGDEDLFFDSPEPPEDEEFYDFSEYGEDSPLVDEDWPHHLEDDWDGNPFESTDEPVEGIEPEPDIIIDEFGNVEIPRERIFVKYYGKLLERGEALSRTAQLLRMNAQMLRNLGERLVELEGDIILGGERDFSKVNLLPLTQKDLLEPLGIREKSMRTRISNCYIQTPYWGTLHLSVFLQGAKSQWERVVNKVLEILASENFSAPYSNKVVWERIKSIYPTDLKDNRQFRNIMKREGIPLKKARKEIYDATKRWQQEEKRKKVRLSEIPKIRNILQDKYHMFTTKQTVQCRQPQFVPFVEERIAGILRLLGVEVSNA